MEKTKRSVERGPVGERVRANVRHWRRVHEMTLEQLAAKVTALGRPMVLTAVSKIEQGDRRIDVDDLVAFALALGVSPNRLMLQDPAAPNVADEIALTGTRSMLVADALDWAYDGRGAPPSPEDKQKVRAALEEIIRERQETER